MLVLATVAVNPLGRFPTTKVVGSPVEGGLELMMENVVSAETFAIESMLMEVVEPPVAGMFQRANINFGCRGDGAVETQSQRTVGDIQSRERDSGTSDHSGSGVDNHEFAAGNDEQIRLGSRAQKRCSWLAMCRRWSP